MTAIEPVSTVDYHTGGEPFRIVTGGVPTLAGANVLARRAWAMEHLEDVRHLLVDEPRGHADMYGGFVTPPDDDGADLGVVFFHNEGYSTACGHGTIALVTWALESGVVAGREADDGTRQVVVDVPSGRLTCHARFDAASGRVASVRFRNVPAFVLAVDVPVETSRGPLTLDIGFGGAFYGTLDVRHLGSRVEPAALPALIALQRELRPALEAAVDVAHPTIAELAGIYGVIFWEPVESTGVTEGSAAGHVTLAADGPLAQRNVTVFADGEVDRSPCGSGTSARLAVLHARGGIATGRSLEHRSIVDSIFHASVVAAGPSLAGHATVITDIEGSAFATGVHRFELDPRDPLGTGFLLR